MSDATDWPFAAEQITRAFAPARVFDAACGSGGLVAALRACGVDAIGRDRSLAALAALPTGARAWCALGTAGEVPPGPFDLIVCLGGLDGLAEATAQTALRRFAAAAPRVLFAAGADARRWLGRWAAAGMAPRLGHDASYLSPGAYLLEPGAAADLDGFAALLTHRAALAQSARRTQAEAQRRTLAGQAAQAAAEAALARSQAQSAEAAAADAFAEAVELRAARDAAQAALAAAVQRAEVAEQARAQSGHTEAAARAETAQTQAALAALKASLVVQTAERVRRAAGRLPAPLRKPGDVAVRVASVAVGGKLGARLRERQAAQARARLVAACPLFDAAWYLARNPDVALSGMDPALHFATSGSAEGRDPGPNFSTPAYLLRHPEARGVPGGALLHALALGAAGDGAASSHSAAAAPGAAEGAGGLLPTADDLLRAQFPYLNPLPVFAAPDPGGRRLTVVLDSLGADSLYGGVGTALILSALTALRLRASLRVVTRTQPAEPRNVGNVLRLHGIAWDGNIDFVFAPNEPKPEGQEVPLSPRDLFLTTSWWSTVSTRQSVPRARIAYLLQEDERMFYPFGDDHLRCSETLADPGVLYLVNSNLLLAHLREQNLAPGAVAFEPAFPDQVYRRGGARQAGGKRGFFFYARPLNARNLYWRGLEALCAAIEEGVLDPAAWDFHFAGHGAAPLALPRGAKALFPGPMPWPRYAAFISGMEAGLSLMYTPHPSYPPLDLAASGAAVVTNRFGLKRELDSYSANIICTDPDVPSLLAGLRRAAALADDPAARAANAARDGLQRDWATAMAPAVERLAVWADG